MELFRNISPYISSSSMKDFNVIQELISAFVKTVLFGFWFDGKITNKMFSFASWENSFISILQIILLQKLFTLCRPLPV